MQKQKTACSFQERAAVLRFFDMEDTRNGISALSERTIIGLYRRQLKIIHFSIDNIIGHQFASDAE